MLNDRGDDALLFSFLGGTGTTDKDWGTAGVAWADGCERGAEDEGAWDDVDGCGDACACDERLDEFCSVLGLLLPLAPDAEPSPASLPAGPLERGLAVISWATGATGEGLDTETDGCVLCDITHTYI